MREFEGQLDGPPTGSLAAQGFHIALVVSRFHEAITKNLLSGALAELEARGVPESQVTLAWVPGALELPLVAQTLAQSGQHDAVVVLGCVIRGDTDHYDFVCSETTRGCGRVALEHSLPVLFGLLTCDTMAQAVARSGPNADNKGTQCAQAALRMIRLQRSLKTQGEDTP